MSTTKVWAKGCVVVLAPIESLDDQLARWEVHVACKVYCQFWPRPVVLRPEFGNSSRAHPSSCSWSDSFHWPWCLNCLNSRRDLNAISSPARRVFAPSSLCLNLHHTLCSALLDVQSVARLVCEVKLLLVIIVLVPFCLVMLDKSNPTALIVAQNEPKQIWSRITICGLN